MPTVTSRGKSWAATVASNRAPAGLVTFRMVTLPGFVGSGEAVRIGDGEQLLVLKERDPYRGDSASAGEAEQRMIGILLQRGGIEGENTVVAARRDPENLPVGGQDHSAGRAAGGDGRDDRRLVRVREGFLVRSMTVMIPADVFVSGLLRTHPSGR